MAAKLTSIIVMAVFVAAATGRPQSFPCSDKPDGVYPDPLDRTMFHFCLDGDHVFTQTCDSGQYFDQSAKMCVSENGDGYHFDGARELTADDGEILSEIEKILETVALPEDGPRGISKYKVYNVHVKRNNFPKSLVMVGQANREQKNK